MFDIQEIRDCSEENHAHKATFYQLRRQNTRVRRNKKAVAKTHLSPINNRHNLEIQTTSLLEPLDYEPPVLNEVATQYDATVEPNKFPEILGSSKFSQDRSTQIERGDLFNFEVEIGPILDALVGKVLSLSLKEAREAAELSAIRKRRKEFEMMRDIELKELKVLEEEARKRFEEKQCKIRQEQQHYLVLKELKERIAAKEFAADFFSEVCSELFATSSENEK
uniref:Radial spoke protein 3 n=1 Tax=Corethron hystrix TaxID=216773 RepID=A0A7S1FNI3_9STRA